MQMGGKGQQLAESSALMFIKSIFIDIKSECVDGIDKSGKSRRTKKLECVPLPFQSPET